MIPTPEIIFQEYSFFFIISLRKLGSGLYMRKYGISPSIEILNFLWERK
jgi:hypothetical protein